MCPNEVTSLWSNSRLAWPDPIPDYPIPATGKRVRPGCARHKANLSRGRSECGAGVAGVLLDLPNAGLVDLWPAQGNDAVAPVHAQTGIQLDGASLNLLP